MLSHPINFYTRHQIWSWSTSALRRRLVLVQCNQNQMNDLISNEKLDGRRLRALNERDANSYMSSMQREIATWKPIIEAGLTIDAVRMWPADAIDELHYIMIMRGDGPIKSDDTKVRTRKALIKLMNNDEAPDDLQHSVVSIMAYYRLLD